MCRRCLCARWRRLAVLAAVLSVATIAAASDNVKGVGPFNPEHETVEIFDGIASGKLDVQIIPKDASRCRLLVANRTGHPLNVRVPEVLGAAPVLAQVPNGPPGGLNQPNNAASQSVGFPMPSVFGGPNAGGNRPLFNVPNPGGNRPGGNNWGLFNVAPEAVGQFRLQSVCLEHGKPNPRAAIPYRLVRLETLAPKPEVAEVLRMLGSREVDQKTAQAAAWRLNNGMSWAEVAAVRIRHMIGPAEPFFTPAQIANAKKAVERAGRIVAESQKAAAASNSVSAR